VYLAAVAAASDDPFLAHWYVKPVGAPDHVPLEQVSTFPGVGVPEICGAAELTGT
jgi:hypothetical protein